MKLKYITFSLIVFLSSCAPMTKEAYLQDYEEFINEVSKESSKYSESDWQEVDEKFDKFANEWYKKFEDEFTWKEDLIISKYKVQYNLYRHKQKASEFLGELFGSYSDLEKKVKYYAENNMSDDIDFLIKQANEAGGSAVDVLNQVLADLELEQRAQSNEN